MNPLACPLDTCCATAPRRERRKDARPRELLDAALALFVEQGFAATKAEDVARRAGVSKGTLFLYFTSKEELFKAVVRENIVDQFSEFNVALDTFTGTTETLLRTFMNAWWHRVGATHSAGICKLMVSEGRQFPELADFYRTEVIDPACQIIGRVLARGVQRGELHALPAQHSVYTLLAPILFLMLWNSAPSLSGSLALDGPAFLDTQIDVLLNGIGVRQPTANPTATPTSAAAPVEAP